LNPGTGAEKKVRTQPARNTIGLAINHDSLLGHRPWFVPGDTCRADQTLVFEPYQKDRVCLGHVKPLRGENSILKIGEAVYINRRVEDKIEQDVRMRGLIALSQPPDKRRKAYLGISRDRGIKQDVQNAPLPTIQEKDAIGALGR